MIPLQIPSTYFMDDTIKWIRVGHNKVAEIIMGIYRTSRPMIVDAVRCTGAKTIATDLGFINVKRGDWVICGECNDCYVVDDAFFQRTFVAVQGHLRTPEPDEWKLWGHPGRFESGPAQVPPQPCCRRGRTRPMSHMVRRSHFPTPIETKAPKRRHSCGRDRSYDRARAVFRNTHASLA